MPHRTYGQHLSYMFETPTTKVWQRLYRQGKLNAAQSTFWKKKPAEELFDMQADPDEIVNLASSPKSANVLKRMRDVHREWERQIRDVDFLSEWEMRKRAKNSTPYEVGHDPAQYDFDAIFAAADIASSIESKDAAHVVPLLDSPDSAVRYWGAVGLLARESNGVQAGHDKLIAALSDKSPMVRIVAAEALGRFGNAEDAAAALDTLVKYASAEQNYYLAIAAWNGLDFLGDRAAPALPLLEAISATRANVPPRVDAYTTRLKEKTLRDLKRSNPGGKRDSQ
jgi:uncharacterized sulfatase